MELNCFQHIQKYRLVSDEYNNINLFDTIEISSTMIIFNSSYLILKAQTLGFSTEDVRKFNVFEIDEYSVLIKKLFLVPAFPVINNRNGGIFRGLRDDLF